jgi:hypothetical protein
MFFFLIIDGMETRLNLSHSSYAEVVCCFNISTEVSGHLGMIKSIDDPLCKLVQHDVTVSTIRISDTLYCTATTPLAPGQRQCSGAHSEGIGTRLHDDKAA